MAKLERLLAPDEELVLDLHPHWRRLVVPFLGVPTVAAATTFALLTGPVTAGFRYAVLALAAVVLVAVSVLPYLRWRTTRYLVTDRRVLGRSGILTRTGSDVPLYRVEDVHYENSLADRVLRSGDLVLESAGEHGGLRLVDVPRVEQVTRTISSLLESYDRRRRELPVD